MPSDLLTQIQRLMRPLANRIANSIARAVVQTIDDSKKLQLLQLGVLDGEDIDDGERFGQYGFFSVPPAGAEAVVLFPNGDRGHPLVVAVDDRRHRPTGGESGESGIYNDADAIIRLTKDGDITITCKAGRTVSIDDGSGAAALATKADLSTLKSAISGAAVTAGDGGAVFKTNIMAALSAWPAGTTVLKGK